MATRQENTDIRELQKEVGVLTTNVAVIQTDIGYIKASATKMDNFIEDNKPGIKTASILNNSILTYVITAIIVAGVVYAATNGSTL